MAYNRNKKSNNRSNNGKKYSGSKTGKTSSGATWISGWKATKRFGIVSVIASSRKDGKKTHNKNGEELIMFVCNIKSALTKQLATGFYNDNTKRLSIPDFNIVIDIRNNYMLFKP